MAGHDLRTRVLSVERGRREGREGGEGGGRRRKRRRKRRREDQVLVADFKDPYQPDDNVRGLEGDELIEAFVDGTKKKIRCFFVSYLNLRISFRNALDVAKVEGNDSLVLGAIRCCVFLLFFCFFVGSFVCFFWEAGSIIICPLSVVAPSRWQEKRSPCPCGSVLFERRSGWNGFLLGCLMRCMMSSMR